MATYVKLKGLARDTAIGDAGVMRGRGVRVRLPFKQAQGGTGVVRHRTLRLLTSLPTLLQKVAHGVTTST
jgi:hypothetical protein